MGIFNFKLSGSILPNSLRSFLFDPETGKEMDITENSLENDESNEEMRKRSNWIERLMELRSHWRERQQNDDVDVDGEHSHDCNEDEGGCEVDYGDEQEEGKVNIDSESFSRLLAQVPWSDAKLFSQMAFLCNMAYVIPEIEANDLRRHYGLHFVTSSLEKKSKAEALKAKLDQDSIRIPVASSSPTASNPEKTKKSEEKHLNRPAVAYEIAASAASYAKDLLSLGSESKKESDDSDSRDNVEYLKEEGRSPPPRVYKSEVAAYMAASTMTAVVAAGEKEKQEAAKALQSLHSSPCEWFICDDPSTYTRQFVIQGSDSLASWQANLFFDPTEFEGTGVLVHRGIYEAAKGIYEQFMPEIMEHMHRFGERAKLQFTGHSLGGSLSLLVHLMLLTRKVVKASSLREVVTIGSPFVFCGGQKVLDKLGLDEDRIHCLMMHRDIVPRAFACNYPNHVAQVLKRLSGSFQSHPCLNKKKLLYSPMGKIFILQPDEKSSPPHPLLPPGSALYALENTHCGFTQTALRTFLNSPHPLDTLSNPTAYGSEGTILRDHDSSNYLKAINAVIRQQTKTAKREKKQSSPLWPILTSQSPHLWSHEQHNLTDNRMVKQEVMTSV
ncbi:Protein zntA like [Actinidia chinensis var. chinensis]|uniref:Protein zntA like n=1 Tax=Actinidia chinensis var. chinensis TaxID=1590841 RepID=A0A2R6R9I4_ACTCC|nr:Protein zntA like [Actinidia chinensis var. chinensis]